MSKWKAGDVCRASTGLIAMRTSEGWTYRDGSVGGLHQDGFPWHAKALPEPLLTVLRTEPT